MGFYADRVLPYIIGIACGAPPSLKQREKVVPNAQGRVLEIGMGSGLNLQYYDPSKVELVFGLEPSEGMRRKAQENLAASPVEVRLLELPGEEVPLDDDSIDTVVLTYTLCTIPDFRTALAQMRRVLKPGGRFLCLEFSQVVLPVLDKLYETYSFKVLPALGERVAGDRQAYQYLAESIRRFPAQGPFAEMITEAGLEQVKVRNLSGGIAAIHSAWRV